MGSHASAQARSALDSIRRLVRALREAAAQAQQRSGVSAAQLFVLQQLAEQPARSLQELADRTLTHQSSVSVVVSRLVDAGLVSRVPSPSDGRRVELRLTIRGRSALLASPELPLQQRLIAALEELPQARRSRLAGDLRALVDALGVERGAAPMFFEDRGGSRKERARREDAGR